MNQREKLLGLGFAAVIILWQGQGLVNWIYFDRVEQKEAEIERLTKKLDQQQRQKVALAKATKKMNDWSLRSLPPDPLKAEPEYYKWLTETAKEKLGASAVVKTKKEMSRRAAVAAPPKPTGSSLTATGSRQPAKPTGPVYQIVSGNIKATATLDKVRDFLYHFQQSGFLHRVTAMQLVAAKHVGNPELDVTIDVEALALRDSPPRSTLIADANKPPKPDEPLKPLADYGQITSKNLFVKGYDGPPKATRSTGDSPIGSENFDEASFVKLVGIVSEKGVSSQIEGWLYNQSKNEVTYLPPGAKFKIDGSNGTLLEGTTVAVEKRHIVLEVLKDQELVLYRLDLGDSLKQLKRMPKRETVSVEAERSAPPE